ncbi:hypothetical protein JW992_10805 [candidate division KSB1 bacterium]|nr:hypothetical protein [candidate division KSB1 bacterium]
MATKKSSNIDRRRFFRHFFGQSAVLTDEARGKPQLRLSDLPKLTDEQLARIYPKLIANTVIRTAKDGRTTCHQEQTPETRVPLNEAEAHIISAFDGRKSIGQIAAGLKQQNAESAFAETKSLFLRLVDAGLCFPTNAVGNVDKS